MGRGCTPVSVRDAMSAGPNYCTATDRRGDDFLVLVLSTFPERLQQVLVDGKCFQVQLAFCVFLNSERSR